MTLAPGLLKEVPEVGEVDSVAGVFAARPFIPLIVRNAFDSALTPRSATARSTSFFFTDYRPAGIRSDCGLR